MIGSQLVRRFTTTAICRSGHNAGGIPGSNLPFSTNNKYKLLLYFTLFVGSGLSLPFIIVRHQLLK